MEGQVTLSIKDYQELIDKVSEYESLETRFRIYQQELNDVKEKYHDLLIENVYNQEQYVIANCLETYGRTFRDELFNALNQKYHMDSVKQINEVIEELIEMYKEKNDVK